MVERLELAEIVSFTSVLNLRSRAVMERIGARNIAELVRIAMKVQGMPPS